MGEMVASHNAIAPPARGRRWHDTTDMRKPARVFCRLTSAMSLAPAAMVPVFCPQVQAWLETWKRKPSIYNLFLDELVIPLQHVRKSLHGMEDLCVVDGRTQTLKPLQ